MSQPTTYPLFQAHPRFEALPRAGLLGAATPVQSLGSAGWIKRDDLSAAAFGGNKIRKLDLLLADARARGRRSLLCFGYSGSNFVAATAWHGRKLGLDTLGLLLPQADAPYVGANLALALYAGARLEVRDTAHALIRRAVLGSLRSYGRQGRWPYWMPPGGSTPLGAVGFVNAAFELRQQIDSGLLPAPHRLYVAFSSMGTVAGLSIGLGLAGIDCRIQAIQVVDAAMASRAKLDSLIHRTQRLLRRHDPRIATNLAAVDIRNEYFGPAYAVPTSETRAAMQRFTQDSSLHCDSAYTGKALTAYYADLDRNEPGPLLYWHSFNGQPLPTGLAPLTGATLQPYLIPSQP